MGLEMIIGLAVAVLAAIAGVFGMMVSVGLAFILEFLDRTLKIPTDVERQLGLPLIGAIPDIEMEKKLK